MTKKTTKHKTTPTQPARLSTYEKKTLAEVDWDLLAEMDAEDEGQPVPMRDNPSTKNPAQDASPDPDRQLDDGGDAGNLQTPSRGQGQGGLSQQGLGVPDTDGQSQYPVQKADLAGLGI